MPGDPEQLEAIHPDKDTLVTFSSPPINKKMTGNINNIYQWSAFIN